MEAPLPQLNLPPLPPPLTPNGTVVEDIVVRVNDQIISRSDVERSEQQLATDGAQSHASPAQLTQMQKDMLRDMIDQQLLLSRAKELGLNADADVIRQLDDIRKRNNMASLDDLEKAARSQGVSFEDFKAQIRNQILTQQVVRDEVGRKLQLTQSDEAKYYDEHKADFQQPEQIRLSEILVPLAENATPSQISQAEAKANGVKTEIMQGGNFAEIAKKVSGGPSAAQGGELGLFKRGALAKVLEDQTFDLKVGESTQPVRTRQGFVILQVTQHDIAGTAAMKDVESQIQEAIYMQQMQPKLREYLTKLRTQAYVDIQPGFVDSGATGNESRLVNTAYAPPSVKKKKVVVKKARYDRTLTARKVVVASPDTTGGRTLTGSEVPVDQNTGLAILVAPVAVNKPAKGVRREKIRFGQAPRNSLPGSDAAEETTVTSLNPATAPTPGTVTVPQTELASAGNESANLADNPLTPRAPEAVKTRFAARAKEEKEKKAKTVSAKKLEKASAKPLPESAQEKADEKTQALPLSVSGVDESKKVKKPKKVKGAPKERLADKPATPVSAGPAVAPTASPSLAPTLDASPVKKPDTTNSNQTALPGTSNPPPNTPPVTIPPPTS